jgi:hypothetical protein
MPDEPKDDVVMQRLQALERDAKKHDHAIFGNGRPGLIQDVATMKASVISIEQITSRMQSDMAQQRRESSHHSQEIVRVLERLKNSLAVVEKLEKIVTPVVNWKRKFVIQVATVFATLGCVGAGLAFLFQFWPAIKSFISK